MDEYPSYLLSLPDEVLLNVIFPRLDLHYLLYLCEVNVKFSKLCQQDSMWKERVNFEFPDFLCISDIPEFSCTFNVHNIPPNTSWKDYYIFLYQNVINVKMYRDEPDPLGQYLVPILIKSLRILKGDIDQFVADLYLYEVILYTDKDNKVVAFSNQSGKYSLIDPTPTIKNMYVLYDLSNTLKHAISSYITLLQYKGRPERMVSFTTHEGIQKSYIFSNDTINDFAELLSKELTNEIAKL